jgi:general secretion pathway protein C
VELAHKIQSLRDRSPEQWLTLANQELPAITAWVLVLFIAWHGAQLLWSLFPGEPEFDWSRRTATVGTPVNNADVSVDFRAIASAHLFGEADAQAPPSAVVKAPETRLNLKLRGTIAADDETIAHAIISDDSNNAKVYFVEDSVPGGATLHEVHTDRVILNRGGSFETLRLPKQSQNLGIQRATAGNDTDDHGGSRRNTLRSAVGSNPTAFTEVIRPQPFMPNGEMRGYRVYPGRDRKAFAALGLRPGDLVTEINGQTLDNLREGMEIFRQLGDATQMTVTIERNGSPMALTLDSSQFNNASGARR